MTEEPAKPLVKRGSDRPAARREVDLQTFLTAHRDGKADQYKTFLVKGVGLNCNGDTKIEYADGREEVFFILSPFAVHAGGKIEPVGSFKEYIEASLKKQRVLQIVLYGKDLKPYPRSDKELHFSGVFQGEYKSVTGAIGFGPDGQPPLDKAPILRDCDVSF